MCLFRNNMVYILHKKRVKGYKIHYARPKRRRQNPNFVEGLLNDPSSSSACSTFVTLMIVSPDAFRVHCCWDDGVVAVTAMIGD